MAGVAASQAAIAQAAAHEAKVERCKAEIAGYDSKTSSVKQAQSYADCIRTVYPEAMSVADITGLKAVFVVALVCGIIGGWREKNGRYTDLADIGMMFFLWFFLGPMILGSVAGVLYGIYWVLT